jgi:hypothetical protein
VKITNKLNNTATLANMTTMTTTTMLGFPLLPDDDDDDIDENDDLVISPAPPATTTTPTMTTTLFSAPEPCLSRTKKNMTKMTMQFLDPIDSALFPTPPLQDDDKNDNVTTTTGNADADAGCCVAVSCPEDETELGEFLLDAVDWL